MLKRILVLTLLSLFFMTSFLLAENSNVFIEVSGAARLTSDAAASRTAALMSAKKNGLEQVLLDYLDPTQLAANFKKLTEKIINQPDNFISNFKIIEEQKDEKNGLYRLSSEFQTDRLKIVKILKELGLQKKWVLLVLADEWEISPEKSPQEQSGTAQVQIQIGDHLNQPTQWGYYEKPCPAAEIGLTKKIIAAGFKVLDPKTLQKINRPDLAIKILDPGSKRLNQLAEQLPAEIIVSLAVIGDIALRTDLKPEESHGGMGFNIKTGRANLHLKAVRADSGEILATETFQGNGRDLTETLALEKAIGNAAETAGDFLTEKISVLPTSSLQQIRLALEGFPGSQFQAVLKIIKNFPGLVSLQVSGQTKNETTALINFRGSSARLANLIENSRALQNYNLVVKNLTAGSITLNKI